MQRLKASAGLLRMIIGFRRFFLGGGGGGGGGIGHILE